eukprot:UN15586
MRAEVLQLEAETKVEDYAVKALLKGLKHLSNSPYTNWVNWVPEDWIENDYVQMGILAAGKDCIEQEVRIYVQKYAACLFAMTMLSSAVSYNHR